MKKLIITKEQYNSLIKAGLIKESSVKGGIDRVQKTFNNAFAGKDIKSVSEDSDFNIKAPNTDLPRAQQKPLGPKHNIDEAKKGSNNKISKEIKDLLKHLYGYTPEFNSDYWVGEKNKSSDEICEYLSGKGHIIKKGRNYIVPKSIGTKEEAKAAIEECMREFVGEPMEEIEEDLDTYDTHSPDNPSNKEDPEPIENNTDYDIFVYNDGIAILNQGTEFFLLDFFDNGVDYEGREMSEDDINYFLNDKEGELPKILMPLNIELVDELGEIYPLNPFFMKKLEQIKTIMGGLSEGLEDFSNEYPERSPEDMESLQKKIQARRAKELASREPMGSKHPHGEWNDPKQTELDLDEMTSAAGGSSGAFTPPMGATPIKRKIETVYESTVASTGNFQYDNPGLANIGRNGEFKEPKKKTKAQAKTQWAGGAFVELDDCTKLNNNKEAQKGGCSTGAVDGVVKLKKTSGNVNAPSLSEGIMREALKLQHDKNQGKLIVISDLEGRAASQETFHNKAVLKQNGFNWNGTSWVIDSDKLDIARKTLSLVNKSEYIIDQLEDLEDAVEGSGVDNKDLLKARIDQYIMDLANATDEVALSAEIRRYLTFFSKFHGYSFYNRMLIFIQKPNATKVGSFKLWESKFRRVKKGAKAIKVLAPAGKPEMIQYDDETTALMGQLGMANKPQITRFKAVNVFDISDTEPIDERGDVPDSPQWWGDNTPSETADILFGAVSEVAADLGIRVTQSDAQGGEKGYSAGDHINISSDVSGAGRLSTTIHEIAHELMHWKKSSIYYIDNGQGKESYALGELQAESVSYVVLKHYGIPVAHHATYLALWKANKERIQNNIEIISKVSQFIIDKIDNQVSSVEKQ
jgi:hypothetical protein